MKLKKILISQPEPADLEKSPYKNLTDKYGVELTFYKFFEVVGISASEFRKSRIHLSDYTAVIFSSKNSIDHFFRMAKELREVIPETMKYFCTSEAISFYLQNYTQYRKRKVFFGNQTPSELVELITKHKEEKFIFPCSDEKQNEITRMLDKAKCKYTKAPMYASKSRDLSKFNPKDFDLVTLFAPSGVKSLYENYPDVAEMGVNIAAFGASTQSALKEIGIKPIISAPTKLSPSMSMAIENYINGKDKPEAPVAKATIVKKPTTRGKNTVAMVQGASKKVKPVIANKDVYKQRMAEKKAEAAARRAARAEERKKKDEAAKED